MVGRGGHNAISKSRLRNRSRVLELRSRVLQSTNGRTLWKSRGPLLTLTTCHLHDFTQFEVASSNQPIALLFMYKRSRDVNAIRGPISGTPLDFEVALCPLRPTIDVNVLANHHSIVYAPMATLSTAHLAERIGRYVREAVCVVFTGQRQPSHRGGTSWSPQLEGPGQSTKFQVPSYIQRSTRSR